MDRRYALIKDGSVINVILADEPYANNIRPQYDAVVQSDIAGRDDIYDGTTFTRPSSDQPNTLTITLDKPTVAPGETVTATAEVRLPDGTLAPLTANYVVPVFDVDGRKDQMLKVSFVDGQGSASFSFSDPGIYTIDVGKIRPVPTAQLPDSPEVIVA